VTPYGLDDWGLISGRGSNSLHFFKGLGVVIVFFTLVHRTSHKFPSLVHDHNTSFLPSFLQLMSQIFSDHILFWYCSVDDA